LWWCETFAARGGAALLIPGPAASALRAYRAPRPRPQASSPLQSALVTFIALALAALTTERHAWAAAAAAQGCFRLAGVLPLPPLPLPAKRAPSPAPMPGARTPDSPRSVCGDAGAAASAPPTPPPRRAAAEAAAAAASTSSARPASDAGSSGSTAGAREGLASFRIPDGHLRTAASSSAAAKRSLPPRRRAPRGASLDPPASRDAVTLRHKPRTSLDYDAAAAPSPLASPRRRRGPRGRSPASPLGAAGAAAGRRARWQPSVHRVASGLELAALGAQSDAAAAAREAAEAAAEAAPAPAPAASWAGSASDALGALGASASGSLGALGAAVDSLLRPLVPEALGASLRRWPSAPLPGRVVAAPLAPAAAAAPLPRGSLDASARHYATGAVAAPPARLAALERLAAAARLQAAAAAAAPVAPRRPGGAAQPSAAARLAAAPGAPPSALVSVGLDGACAPFIRAAVTDEHLLQLGALLGDAAAAAALAELGAPGPLGDAAGSLYGAADAAGAAAVAADAQGDASAAAAGPRWELVADHTRPGLAVRAWRAPLRGGLYLYRSEATIEGVAPADARPFHLDDQARALWDEGALEVLRLATDEAAGAAGAAGGEQGGDGANSSAAARAARHAESCVHAYLSRFPRPMAPRRYLYARRVWHRPADGGCFAICRGCAPPPGAGADPAAAALIAAPGAVAVSEYLSGTLVRAAPGSGGTSTQVLSAYFEDSGVRPGLARVAIPKGIWPFWCRYEGALRLFADARAAAAAARAAPAAAAAGGCGGCCPGCGAAGAAGAPDAEGGDAGANADAGAESDSEGVYHALEDLRRARGLPRRRKRELTSGTVWARRLIIAGALRACAALLAVD
jgi:hypothetical protein